MKVKFVFEITEIIGVILIVKNVLIISATNDKNLFLAKELNKILSTMNVETDLICLEDLNFPLFSPKIEFNGNVVDDLLEKLTNTSGFIICAPEYNGGVPPVLSNALTWVSVKSKYWRDSFNGKFAIIATHSGGDGYRFLSAFRSQLEYMGTNVLSRTISVSNENPLNNESATKILNSFINLVRYSEG